MGFWGPIIAAVAPTILNAVAGKSASDRANKQQNKALASAEENRAMEQARFEEMMKLFMEDRQFSEDLFARFDQPRDGRFGSLIQGQTFLGPLMAALSTRPSISPNQQLGIGNNTSSLLNAQFAQNSRSAADTAFQAAFNGLFGTRDDNGILNLLVDYFGSRSGDPAVPNAPEIPLSPVEPIPVAPPEMPVIPQITR